jgi:hypothetical protein
VTAVPPSEFKGQKAPDDGLEEKKDSQGNWHKVPKGIDLGFDYAPGASLAPRNLSQQAMDSWRAAKADAWETLTKLGWQHYGRPSIIPLDATRVKPGPRLASAQAVISALREQFNGDHKVYSVGGDFNYPVMVDAAVLGEHIDPARSQYLPFLDELMTDPFEVWAMFQQHKGTGKTEMRVRVIKRIDTGDKEGLLLVAQANKGQLEGWTFIPIENMKYLHKQREGVLVYAR